MKIETTIEFKDEGAMQVAKRIANSLAPDNLTNMHTGVKAVSYTHLRAHET